MRKNGKKLLSMLLVAVLGLGLFPESGFAAEKPASNSASTAEDAIYDTIDIYLENKDVWTIGKDRYFMEQNPGYIYGLFDLEGDGIPELFSSGIGGTGFFSDNKFYKLDVATRSVYRMQDLPDALNSMDFYYNVAIYLDNQTSQLLYYGHDFVRNGWQSNGTVYSMFYMENNTVSTKQLWAEYCEVDNNYKEQYTYYYYTNGTDRVEVSESELDQYQEKYLGQYTLLAEDVPTRNEKEMNQASDTALRKNFRDMYDELYQLKLDPVDYLAFSDFSYDEGGYSSIGKNIRTILKSQWDSKWEETDILYRELYAKVSPWVVYDFQSSIFTGFAAYAFKNPLNGRIVIAYRGSRDVFDIKNIDWWTDWVLNDFKMFFGGEGSQLRNAFDFYNSVKAKSGSQNISVTGHSLGGGLADIVAARYGCEGRSFNSAPFLDIAYWYYPVEMSELFAGVDKFTFEAHVNQKDGLVGNWIGEMIKPKILYAPTREGNNHLLPTFVTKDSNGNVCMGAGQKAAASGAVVQTATGGDDHVSLGTSADDRLKYLGVFEINWSDYAIYGGDGGDVLQGTRGSDVIIGGKGLDSLDGNRGNDTYIYYKGDGSDAITDISGKDELVLYGFSKGTRVTAKVMDDFVRVVAGNVPVADISMTRSDKKSNSFVVRVDGTDETLEINDLLTGRARHAKTIRVSCPVNVEVIDDASGAVVHTLRDGQEETSYTQYGNFYVYANEDGEYVKYLDLFEGCSIRIVGAGSGTMDVMVQDISEDLYDPDPFVAREVSVTGDTIVTIEEDTEAGKKTLLIDTDGDGKTDTTCPLTEVDLCAEGHHWSRDAVSTQPNGMLVFTCTACGETKQELPFTDVPASSWYHDSVYWALETEITNGTGTNPPTFSPLRDCKQVEILAFLWRANNQPASSARLPFTPKNSWAEGALRWAVEKGMIDASFDEDAPCTRATAVKFIWQAAGSPSASGGGFTDVPAGADYAQAVAWAVGREITNGTGNNTFSPNKTCNRAEIVTFLYRAYK